MIIYILKKFFKIVIGNLPEEKKRELWIKFNILLEEVVKAAAAGAVSSVMKK